MKILLVSFLISISLIGSSYADFQDGVNAYDQGDFDKAFYEFEPLAENGLAEAQYYLGYMFLKGKAPEEKRSTIGDTTIRPKNDLRNAFPWLEKAAIQGNVNAQRELGLMYSRGGFIGKDIVKANEWWLKAAEQGNTDAQMSVGFSYKKGEGLPQDYKKAMMWFKKAAEKEPVGAAHMVGDMYYEGLGTPINYDEAIKWWGRAVEDGSIGALIKLVYRVEEYMSISDKVKWMRMGAEDGMEYAQYSLGWIYATGAGVLRDDKEAVKWYTKAAEQGYSPAQFYLALMYQDGKGVLKDYKEAVKWYTKAAEQGNPEAQLNLGALYTYGNGKDLTKAKYWTNKAYENPDAGPLLKSSAKNNWNLHELWDY